MKIKFLHLSEFITRGTLATSLFIIVMYARVLPVKTRFYKTFMSLRAPIAIAASFLIFFHNGQTMYHYIYSYKTYGSTLKSYEWFAAGCSIIMFALLIPLTITSFMPVRKKMAYKKWKNLQRTSYIFYALIYLHVSILFSYQISTGKTKYCMDLAIYTLIFGYYFFARVSLYLKTINHKSAAKKIKIAGTVLVASASTCLLSLNIFGQIENRLIKDESVELRVLSNSNSDEETAGYIDGEYIGTAQGYNGEIKVKVTILNSHISEIKILDYEDDYEYFESAKSVIIDSIINMNSTDVDSVSGATYSSKGIKNAVSAALTRAK